MGLTPEQELSDLFVDVLRIAGSPEKGKLSILFISQRSTNKPTAKSALRNFLHENKNKNAAVDSGVHDSTGANDSLTLVFPAIESPSSVPTMSTVSSPPSPVSVGRVVIPPVEYE